MAVSIWHNPRCSKSRQTLQLLQDKGIEPQQRLYLKQPPSERELRDILGMLNLSPRDLMRKKQKEYKELGLANESLSDDDLIRAMVENPVLIERPIVINDGKAAIGRPPENVLNIL
ncbi:MAG: arsenate reductase (glutaredoxin) [Gammaproteobacteria bacterium]|nr:MAG: arsenate reductase (glutaredoxin) [Gammaproteobacteria bacterium]